MILVSSCLLGINSRYDGGSMVIECLKELLISGQAIAVCPEMMGGLKTPRIPCEIIEINGEERVIGKDGSDHTEAYREGARKALEICQVLGITTAVLKFRSPSCGSGKIYDGTHRGIVVDGDGFTARLLKENGIRVLSEMDEEAIRALI